MLENWNKSRKSWKCTVDQHLRRKKIMNVRTQWRHKYCIFFLKLAGELFLYTINHSLHLLWKSKITSAYRMAWYQTSDHHFTKTSLGKYIMHIRLFIAFCTQPIFTCFTQEFFKSLIFGVLFPWKSQRLMSRFRVFICRALDPNRLTSFLLQLYRHTSCNNNKYNKLSVILSKY